MGLLLGLFGCGFCRLLIGFFYVFVDGAGEGGFVGDVVGYIEVVGVGTGGFVRVVRGGGSFYGEFECFASFVGR